MPDNPNRSHPAGISRRDALRGFLLGALGLAVATGRSEAKEPLGQTKPAEEYVPENNYPTFVDEPDSKAGEPS